MTFLYTTTIFLSALLLFLVQPLVGKMILPLLGGAPTVWNTVMVFFQAVLLCGYMYAHFSRKFLGVKGQSVVHLALLGVAALALPIIIPATIPDSAIYHPTPWLLTTLGLAVGLPFFALSANAPMLQSWLARTSHKDAENPYFLYAASNFGSMIALLGYPLVVEPFLELPHQSHLWAIGFALLGGCIALCAAVLWRNFSQDSPQEALTPPPVEIIPARRKCFWVLLAFVPSSLLLGTTTILTTDIASIPLLWVLPLTIYLLSFVLVFAKRPLLYERSRNALFPLAMFIAVIRMAEGTVAETGLMLIYLLLLFAGCMVCHHRLARDKPSPAHLTEFYLWMSAGGVLGGIFNALLAPVLFPHIWEYPLALALACILCPAAADEKKNTFRFSLRDVGAPLVVLGAMAAFFFISQQAFVRYPDAFAAMDAWIKAHNPLETKLSVFSLLAGVAVVIPLGACFLFRLRPLRFGLMIGALFAVGMVNPLQLSDKVTHIERNFFGVVRVQEFKSAGLTVLYHGTTMHGMQSSKPDLRLRPLGYYHPEGPFGDFFRAFSEQASHGRIGIMGLGAGSLACLARSSDTMTYYEIDPVVDNLARDPHYFTFLRDCPPEGHTVLGDARLSLVKEPDGTFDMLVVDVFSSDAIPTHLLTREAFALYMKKLAPGGVIAVHISNRHLDLAPVVSAVARSVGLDGAITLDKKPSADGLKFPTELVVLSTNQVFIARLQAESPGWKPLPPARPEMLWTDSFSNILRVLRH